MRGTLLWLSLVAGLAAAACSPSAPAADSSADLAAINQVRTDYMAAFNGGDMAKLGSLHTEDAMEFPSNEPTRQGRVAIIAATEAMAKEGKAEIALTPTETHAAGDWGVDIGTYRFTMTPTAGGSPMTRDGRYTVILHRQADGWKLARLMDNSPAPMMMPPGGMPMGNMPMGNMPMGNMPMGAPPAGAPPATPPPTR